MGHLNWKFAIKHILLSSNGRDAIRSWGVHMGLSTLVRGGGGISGREVEKKREKNTTKRGNVFLFI